MRIFAGAYDRLGGKGLGQVFLKEDGRHFDRIEWDGSAPDPSYLSVNRAGTRLYAACEAESSKVAAWDISEKPRFLGWQPVAGQAVCHVCSSPDERYLYAAGYMSGTLHVYPVGEEGVCPCVQDIQLRGRGEDPLRQDGPHAHCAMFAPDGRHLCLCDLGQDAVIVYRQNEKTGRLTEASRVCFSGGLGVRHIAFLNGHTAFAVHEMGNAVSRLRYEDGRLTREATWAVLGPEWRDKSTCAAIRIWEDRVYVSNRGRDTVCAFDFDGKPLGEWETGGKCPRDILLLGGGRMLCANQDSGSLTLIDLESGKILDTVDAPGAVGLAKTER